MQWSVLRRKHGGHGQQIVRADSLVSEMVAQVFEPETSSQREPSDGPSILRVQPEQALHLLLERRLVVVRGELIGHAVIEEVLELAVVVVVDRVPRVVVVIAETELRRM